MHFQAIFMLLASAICGSLSAPACCESIADQRLMIWQVCHHDWWCCLMGIDGYPISTAAVHSVHDTAGYALSTAV
jgi:hypothetical protein